MKNVYGPEIKLFALDRRREGKGWGEIRKLIRDKFRPNPLPSIRGMLRWDKLDYEELSKMAAQKVEQHMEIAKDVGLTRAAETQLHNLWELRLLGEQIEYEGWRFFLSLLESTLGSEKFRKYMGKYQSERAGQPDLQPSLLE